MVPSNWVLLALSFSPSALAAFTIQKPKLQVPPNFAPVRDEVKDLFTNAFSAYTKFAFGHDDLTPVTKSFTDGRNGWGASIVDAMDTMKIMGLEDLFQTAINFSSQIDFSKSNTPDTVSLFESTIRYVGGLLSAYQLNGNKPQILVEKAQQLTDKLALGFAASPVPFGFVDFSVDQPVIATSNVAEAGTLTLEWSTLSQLTGNPKYRNLSESSVRHIAQLTPPLPGLPAQSIDPQSGDFIGAYVSWGGGTDSYLEYLVKYTRLDPTIDPLFLQTWETAVDSSIKWLLKESTVDNWLFLADFEDDRVIRHIGSHLACFHGGNWILGGSLLNNQTIVNIGLKLVDACINTYASTATGIGPEVFSFISKVTTQPPNGTDDGNFTDSGVPIQPSDLAFNAKHGFYFFPDSNDYILRPEVLESNFYAWRVSGDTKYLQNAENALRSFQKFLIVPGGDGGVSGLNDVNNATVTDSTRVDDTESFFFAEVMKYLYLTFDDPTNISIDEWVFNTEAHPLRAPSLNGPLGGKGPIPNAPYNAAKVASAPFPEISKSPKAPTQINQILGGL
ncbi:glycoside hydrolase family 47 protein [Sphaerobolus stellatus SS14]|uniref:alpha-1,2-Mannosidase n=1 Tax=Sphaerobolus stellatus (strain SS14) TaxID=990650 RepID=A0A0C9USG4_SPHS4|nr:glycoside hydrolase family 47 protein [Sphaerobolus stellatus SS14]